MKTSWIASMVTMQMVATAQVENELGNKTISNELNKHKVYKEVETQSLVPLNETQSLSSKLSKLFRPAKAAENQSEANWMLENEYLTTTLNFGTPAQALTVVLSTTDIAVGARDSECSYWTEDCTPDGSRPFYDNTASSTYSATNTIEDLGSW